MKKNFKTGIGAGILIGILVTSGLGTGAYLVTDGFTNLTAEKGKLDLTSINRNIRQLEDQIDKNYLNTKDNKKLEQYIYKGFLAGLEDPYSQYYTAAEYHSLQNQTAGSYCGIGANISQNYSTMETSILSLFKDSPAADAGMKAGDIIKEVDGVDVSTMDVNEMINDHILGEKGTTVKIKVYRPENKEKLTLSITRRQVEAEYVTYEMLKNRIGYIKVTSFTMATTKQFQKAIKDLRSEGAESLVIDLRNNPGGVLDSAVDMLASLLPDGKLIYTKDKAGKGDEYYSKNGKIMYQSDYDLSNESYPKKDSGQLDMPMAILINGNSASASEVFAQSMKDYKWAVIVGTQSFGKGIVQNLIPFNNGAAIKLTTASYFTKSGTVIQGKGVTPDVRVEQTGKWAELPEALPPHDEDRQLQKAIEELQNLL